MILFSLTMHGFILSYLKQKPLFDEEPDVAPQPIRTLKPILLLWQKSDELPFLKKVADALTREVEPAECYEWEGGPLPSVKLILGDAQTFNIGVHEISGTNPTLLGMAKSADYAQSVELKRELWMRLKNIGDLLA